MFHSFMASEDRSARRCIIGGIPILIAIGSLMHFVYDWTGNSVFVSIFVPINESVWEHLKMSFWPMVFFWTGCYLFNLKRKAVSPSSWFFSAMVSIYSSVLFIIAYHYTYRGALGIHSLFMDILSFILGVAFGQLVALHIYRYSKIQGFGFLFAVLSILALMAAFIVFTFIPPHIPLFLDTMTGTYGLRGFLQEIPEEGLIGCLGLPPHNSPRYQWN